MVTRYMLLVLFAALVMVGAGCGNGDAQDTAHEQKGVAVGTDEIVPDKSLLENINLTEDLDTLARLLSAAGLNDSIRGAGPYTIFAPSDGAFERASGNIDEEWFKPANKAKARKALEYLIVPGRFTTNEFRNGLKMTTLSGAELRIAQKGDKWVVNDSVQFIVTDAVASNGVIHVIDTALAR